MAAILLMIVSVVAMALVVGFIVWINARVQREQRERHFGDISHVEIPDDLSSLDAKKKRPKPPYRPF